MCIFLPRKARQEFVTFGRKKAQHFLVVADSIVIANVIYEIRSLSIRAPKCGWSAFMMRVPFLQFNLLRGKQDLCMLKCLNGN